MIHTTELFWDCECKKNYIHPASEKVCNYCKAERNSSPDSRINEVLAYKEGIAFDEQDRIFCLVNKTIYFVYLGIGRNYLVTISGGLFRYYLITAEEASLLMSVELSQFVPAKSELNKEIFKIVCNYFPVGTGYEYLYNIYRRGRKRLDFWIVEKSGEFYTAYNADYGSYAVGKGVRYYNTFDEAFEKVIELSL